MSSLVLETLACPVCFEKFTPTGTHVPRILSCAHTFCSSCLDDLAKHNRRVPCPLCRCESDKLINSAAELRVNTNLLDVIEAMQSHDDTQSARGAPADKYANPTICSECEDPSRAICLTCSLGFCDIHATAHMQSKKTKHHEITKRTQPVLPNQATSHTISSLQTIQAAVEHQLEALKQQERLVSGEISVFFEQLSEGFWSGEPTQ